MENEKFILFKGSPGPFSKVYTIRINKDQVTWIKEHWDKETFGDFSTFLRNLIESIKSNKVNIKALLETIGYERVPIKNGVKNDSDGNNSRQFISSDAGIPGDSKVPGEKTKKNQKGSVNIGSVY